MTYTEDSLVEQPAIKLFAELGWETLSASDEVMGNASPSPQPSPARGEGVWLGRETKSEVVLAVRLRAVLVRLNPSLPPEAISAAVDELSRDRSAMLPAAANRELWTLMRDGVKVSVPDLARGGQHFLGCGFQGKAMVVSIDKATALRMYEKVRKYWPADDKTDMAVVVSAGQNEIEQMAKLGIDIVPHRKRMIEEKLDDKFKDPNDPLRLVFVCTMWLTGFDAPNCSTVYLDKPMRNHTLMQTIARANRVYPGKQSGMIVDYANVFASLEKALSIYGKGAGGAMPVRDKKALADELRYAVNDANVYCLEHGIALAEIENMRTANFAQAGAIQAAADRLMAPETIKRDFLALEALVSSLYRAVKPDPVAVEFAQRCRCLAAIAACIRTVSEPPDISHIMQGIQSLLYIAS